MVAIVGVFVGMFIGLAIAVIFVNP